MSVRSLLMIVHSYCPADPRVRREAEALAARGDRVDVICLRAPGQSAHETISGVRYLRLPIRRRRGGVVRYLIEYAALFLGATALSIPLHVRHRYRVVQAHNMPDFLVGAGFFAWLSGASLALDLHDPVPELYRAKFGFGPSAPLIRALTAVEGWSIRFADRVFVATGAFRERLLERGRSSDRLVVVLNSPDPAVFSSRENGAARADRPLRLLFHGTVAHRTGADLAIVAAEEVRRRGVDLRLIIQGDGDTRGAVERAASEEDRGEWIEMRPHAPLEEVPSIVASCDLVLIPNRPGPFHDLALPTRIFESLAMERAVVVARSPAISALFAPGELLEFEAGNEADFVRVLEHACRDPEARRACVERGRRVALAHAWEREKATYLDAIDELASRSAGRPAER